MRHDSIIEIKQFLQIRTLLIFGINMIDRVTGVVFFGGLMLWEVVVAEGVWRIVLRCTFDDFIQFAAVEPDAPALQAIIYFHPLAFGGLERFFT